MTRIYTLTIIFVLTACSAQSRSPSVYELPDGFKGWTCIDFNRSECTETPYINGKWIYKFTSTGYLCTSSKIEYGRAKDEWYFIVNNKRTLVPGQLLQHGGVSNLGSSPDNPNSTVQSQFFGEKDTYDEFESCAIKVKKYRNSK